MIIDQTKQIREAQIIRRPEPGVLLFALLLSSTAVMSLAGEIINEERKVKAGGTLSIENESGNVSVVGWDKNTIQIRGELDEKISSFRFETKGEDTVFIVETPSIHTWWSGDSSRGSDTSLEVKVPSQHFVNVVGVNCDINAQQLDGGVKLETANGDIKLDTIGGYVDINTVNGDIRSENLSGKVKMETVSGDINDSASTAKRVSYRVVNGNVNVSTSARQVSVGGVNGDLDLKLEVVEELSIDTVNGDVNSSFSISDDGQVSMSSVSGDMTLFFNERPSAHFNINTHVGGDITNLLTDDRPKSAKYGPSSTLHFDMAPKSKRGGDVNISTVNGDIILKEK